MTGIGATDRRFSRSGVWLLALGALSVFGACQPKTRPARRFDRVNFYAPKQDSAAEDADSILRSALSRSTGWKFRAEYRTYEDLIKRLVTSSDSQVIVARVTPYALVAAELLGADVTVLATYVTTDTARARTTYSSYFVVRRDNAIWKTRPSLSQVMNYVRDSHQLTFCYHNRYSTSSYFLPAIYFRRDEIFDMARPPEGSHASAIATQRFVRDGDTSGTGSSDLVKEVARNRCGMAAVWSATKDKFEEPGSPEKQLYGDLVWFVELPTPLPNDLLVASAALGPAGLARIQQAIKDMGSTAIMTGDVRSWQDINTADSARAALASLRQLARQPPAPATVLVERDPAVPQLYVQAAQAAIRLSGLELVNFVHDYHHDPPDYLWKLEPIHDGALMLRSSMGPEINVQEFTISFRNDNELTSRIGELMRSELHRIRYVWPWTSPPTILRDVDFGLARGTSLKVQKISWVNPQRNAYDPLADINATVEASDFYKFELKPDTAFTFNPMSNISYRVVLERRTDERPIFRVFTAILVALLLLAGAAVIPELRRALRPTNVSTPP